MQTGKIPVVDQGKQLIGGFTDDESRVLDCKLPVIVFGDHTKIVKLINFPFAPGADGTKVLEPIDCIIPKYLAFLTEVLAFKIKDKGYARHYQHIEKELLPITSLPIQRAIVQKIESYFELLDKGIADLKTAQEQLKIYRQAVLKKAFEGRFTNKNVKEGELPEGWKWVKLGEVSEIITGSTPSKKISEFYDIIEFPFYKPTDLEQGINVYKSIDGVSALGFSNGRNAPVGSILVTCIGATIGKSGIIKKEGIFNQQINAIIPSEDYESKFVYYQVVSSSFQEQIKTNASSTTLPILNKSKFSDLDFINCPLSEQHIIVREIESRLSVCDKVEQSISESLEKAEALRQSILKKAFEGKLLSGEEIAQCKQEADYEPASVLLERIRKEKK